MNSLQPFLLGNIDVCGVPGKSYMNTRFFYRKRNGMYFCSIVLKAQSAKALANVSLKLGKVSVDSACCYIFHQPKVPKDLKKLKKI